MKIHLLSGFLGSGKTTAVSTACEILQQANVSVAVITNDQGSVLVDSRVFRHKGIPDRQVVNGCFCCNYTQLEDRIGELMDAHRPTVIFAESVGSCTDIVATVMKPLLLSGQAIEVSFSSFADIRLLHLLYIRQEPVFSPEVRYIFQKQLEEASTIVLTRADLADTRDTAAVQAFLQTSYPGKKILLINGYDPASIRIWLDNVGTGTSSIQGPALDIDYAVYGAGESRLAWLDEVLQIENGNGRAPEEAAWLAAEIYRNLTTLGLPVGHLKMSIDGVVKISYTANGGGWAGGALPPGKTAAVVINARVETDPGTLQNIVGNAVAALRHTRNTGVRQISSAAFVPGFPKPQHRITTNIDA
ncbi:hypothetical protein I5907_21145 [Panacibacter sp. DH6]|uniref:CobW/HypB/UreG nucleotide-binding domain-containing protein n=1 Tax=Panacibacter microcysteis TaxID=2793269 RepID=A0A931H0G6_9BACT|nr:GTP-binding protein [Panacibacter microcysteis]MBG9378752.1 hypothetical protein [Panacibacter microcysteis]